MPKNRKARDGAGDSMEPWLLRVEDAAELLGVSRSTVYSLMNSNQLPSVQIAGCRRIPVDELRAWVEQQSQ